MGTRKHLAWYCKAFPKAAELRSQMVRVNDVDEVVECLRNYAAAVASEFEPTDRAFHDHESRTRFFPLL